MITIRPRGFLRVRLLGCGLVLLVLASSAGCSPQALQSARQFAIDMVSAPFDLIARLGQDDKSGTKPAPPKDIRLIYGQPPLELNFSQVGVVRGERVSAGSPWAERLQAMVDEARRLNADAIVMPQDAEAAPDYVTGRAIVIINEAPLAQQRPAAQGPEPSAKETARQTGR